MKARILLGTLTAAGIALGVGQMTATAVPGEGGTADSQAGPDVIVGEIPDIARYGPATYNGVEYASYAFGSTSCNVGSTQLQWQPNPSNLHPTIPQNLYRVKDGAIEQIGLGWCKHGFCALQQTLCGTCTPAGSGCPTVLGVGCSDPYTATLNGNQSDLKGRGPINASTGYFSGTYTDPTIPSTLPTSLQKRVIVARADLDPALNVGAQYFAECRYIHIDDATAGNDNNNASYRKLTVGSTWSTQLGFPLTLSGSTAQGQPAIMAWKVVHADVVTTNVDVTGDGRFIVGSRAIDNGNGTWRYEFAVQNLNSDRCGGSFSVPLPAGAVVTNVGFKSPKYLNGETYTNAPWTSSVTSSAVTWTCEANTNANANALRWSTIYSFRFTCNLAPTSGTSTLGLWKSATSGSPQTSVSATAQVPANPCRMGDLNCDGVVNGADLGTLLSSWGACAAPCASDLDGNGVVNGADLGIQLAQWGTGV